MKDRKSFTRISLHFRNKWNETRLVEYLAEIKNHGCGDYLMFKHEKAAEFAKNMYAGQLYDGKDYYETHLQYVVDEIADLLADADFNVYSFTDDFCEDLLSCGYLHDNMEDCGTTFNQLKDTFNEFIANVVYACTNEKGKTRKERQNDKFYSELAAQEYASFVKLADRIANTWYSKQSGSSMYQKYISERENFITKATNFKRELSEVEQKLVNLAVEKLKSL